MKEAMQLLSARLPIVVLRIDRPCLWQGKFSANIGTDGVKSLGGPWETAETAYTAILATGYYRQREGNPSHFDRIS